MANSGGGAAGSRPARCGRRHGAGWCEASTGTGDETGANGATLAEAGRDAEPRTRTLSGRFARGSVRTAWRRFCATAALLAVATVAVAADSRTWKAISEDGLHDPGNPAAGILQNPSEALRLLPPDSAGNQVNWVKALRDGYIQPRTNLNETTRVRTLDTDILMKRTVEMPYVRFPHRAHTEWLDCGNCHDQIFRSKAGETPVNMLAILQGEYCGRCHGAVAFPLTECNRCHSVPHDKVKK